MTDVFDGVEMRSRITADGELRIGLAPIRIDDPGRDEVVVQVEATPINPSDLLLLLGPVEPESLEPAGSDECPELRGRVSLEALQGVKGRLGRALTPGNEGAGLVVAAGAGAEDLIGKRVGMRGGGMYAQVRKLPLRDCMVLPEGATTADGAAMFINPLTALCFVETLRAERHAAMVHLAAASNLGRMLNRICLADGIPLVNVVRSAEQAALLAAEGATRILDSTAADYEGRLVAEIADTGATLCFDPIGGGRSASAMLAAMEAAALRGATAYDRYGSDVFKQVYVYGLLDRSPTILDRWVGFAWSVSGWLLSDRLRQLGPERIAALQQRVSDELGTTFRSHYTRTLTLREALSTEAVRAYARKRTGEKFLIAPHRW